MTLINAFKRPWVATVTDVHVTIDGHRPTDHPAWRPILRAGDGDFPRVELVLHHACSAHEEREDRTTITVTGQPAPDLSRVELTPHHPPELHRALLDRTEHEDRTDLTRLPPHCPPGPPRRPPAPSQCHRERGREHCP